MLPIPLLPSDLIFVRSFTVLGWLIRWFQKSQGEEKSWANHTAGIGQSDNVVEALTHVTSTPFEEWQKGKTYEIWRTSDLDSAGRIDVAKFAEKQIGRRYAYEKIIANAGDGLLSKVIGNNPYVFRRMLFMDNYPICSWVWAYAYDKRGLDFGGVPNRITPDDQRDFCLSHPTKWNKIYAYGKLLD